MLYTFENLIYPKNIHLHTNVLQVFALNSYLSASWLKSCFLQLKRSSIQRIYTFVRVFFHFFLLDYLPLCELTTKVFLHLIMFLPKECTPLCKLTKMVFSTLKNVFYMRDIHLCASDFIYFLLKNYPCASWLKRCFLHLKLFSTRRIYTFCAIWLKCLFYT